MPVIAFDLLESIELLAASMKNFEKRCLGGLRADQVRASALVELSLALGTALVPEIGYDRAAALAKEAYESGRTIREVARGKSGIPADRLTRLLDPLRQTGPT